jgi:hypothetical protein
MNKLNQNLTITILALLITVIGSSAQAGWTTDSYNGPLGTRTYKVFTPKKFLISFFAILSLSILKSFKKFFQFLPKSKAI